MDKVTKLKEGGDEALGRGDYITAIQLFTEAIDLDVKNYVLYSNRSAAYTKCGEYEDALKDADTTISLKPDWTKGYARKASALTLLNRYMEALDVCEYMYRIEPNSLLARKGIQEVMSREFRCQVDGNTSDTSDVWVRLNEIIRTREYLKDSEFVREMLDLQEDIGAELLGHKFADERMLRALGLIEGPYVPKEEITDSSMRKEMSSSFKQLKAHQEKEAGNQAYKNRAFENALKYYNKAYEIDPGNITYLINIAAVYYERGEYQKCIDQCAKAVGIGRENRVDFKLIAKAFVRSGKASRRLGDLRGAKTAYEKSMAEHRTPEIKALLSEVEKQIKNEERMAYIDPVKAEEEKEQGNKLFNSGNYAGALKHYSEAIKRNPDDPKYYSNRAACYTKLAAFDLGLKDCDMCNKLDPKFIKGWLRKGKILFGMHHPDKAVNAYQKALELDPKNAEALEGYKACSMNISANPEEVRKRAMMDPEVQAIMGDPAMRLILEQMQRDPKALYVHLKNPDVAANIQKLLACGLIAIK